jgi:hypothetical protein
VANDGRPRGLALVAVALAASAACVQPEATTAETEPQPVTADAAPDSVRDQVLAVVEQYYADLSAREWEYVRGHFWPGATLTTIWEPPGEPGQRVVNTTIESFIEQAPQGPGSRESFSETMTAAHVRGNTDLAQVWATYDARWADPDTVDVWSGVDAFTLLRFEGRWRISSITYVSTDGGGPQ